MNSISSLAIAHKIRQSVRTIRGSLYDVFEQAVVGCNLEKDFLANLTTGLDKTFRQMRVPGITLHHRCSQIHRKPIVKYPGAIKGCELGDLLVIVKYRLPTNETIARSIIYQIKLSNRGTLDTFSIDTTQLTLLCDWPPFAFGQVATGGQQTYRIAPATLEFGSYMLEPRNATIGLTNTGNPKCYGACPYADQVRANGPTAVTFLKLPYKRCDAQNMFSHLAFEIGEPHTTSGVHDLIEALLRYTGMAPDPPEEFRGFQSEDQTTGFAVLEINAKNSGESDVRQKPRQPVPVKKPVSLSTNRLQTTTKATEEEDQYEQPKRKRKEDQQATA